MTGQLSDGAVVLANALNVDPPVVQAALDASGYAVVPMGGGQFGIILALANRAAEDVVNDWHEVVDAAMRAAVARSTGHAPQP